MNHLRGRPEDPQGDDQRQLLLTVVRIDERTASMEDTLAVVNGRIESMDRRIGSQDDRLNNIERWLVNGKGLPPDPTAGPAGADLLDRATITVLTLLWRRHWKVVMLAIGCLAGGGTLVQVWSAARTALFAGSGGP